MGPSAKFRGVHVIMSPNTVTLAIGKPGMKGFTLVELLITLAIIGILASIAVPNYNEYVLKGKLAEAPSQLTTLQTRMEQYYQDNRSYARATACTSPASDCGICPGAVTGLKNFTLGCATSNGGQGFVFTATSASLGYTFTVDETGAKRTTAVGPGSSVTVPQTCWVTSSGGC